MRMLLAIAAVSLGGGWAARAPDLEAWVGGVTLDLKGIEFDENVGPAKISAGRGGKRSRRDADRPRGLRSLGIGAAGGKRRSPARWKNAGAGDFRCKNLALGLIDAAYEPATAAPPPEVGAPAAIKAEIGDVEGEPAAARSSPARRGDAAAATASGRP